MALGCSWIFQAANPSAVIYSFEPVQDLKLLQDSSGPAVLAWAEALGLVLYYEP